MKQTSRLLLLSILLGSCSNVPSSAPAFTETSAPTGTLAFTDTPQPTPTETPDPNMPDGATGKNDKGEYIKETEEGTFVWTVLTDNTGKEVMSLWAESHVLESPANLYGGIPLVEQNSSPYTSDGIVLDISSQEGVYLPYFRHPDNPASVKTEQDLANLFFGIFYKHLSSDPFKAVAIYEAGGASISFKDAAGREYKWTPGPKEFNGRIKYYEIDWTNLTPENFPNVTILETPDVPDNVPVFRWAAFGDKNNNVIILSAVEHPESMDKTEWIRSMIGPIGVILRGNLTQGEAGFLDTQQLVKAAVRDQNPHFEIGPKP